jgi:serine/threonine-protein kinase
VADTDRTTIISNQPSIRSGETFRQGDTIDGKYLVEQVYGGTGKSGMGVVYIVSIGGRLLALKSIQRRFAKDLTIVERFLREARSWMLLGFQPHIVHAYRIDIIDATPFLFLEYIAPDDQGEVTLADYLQQDPLTVEKAMRFAIHCAEGMKRATAVLPHLIHRDLKPENLLVTNNEVLKVTDFGLVRTRLAPDVSSSSSDSESEDEMTAMSGGMLGTPAYMAPEQFDAAGTVGIAADIYAFGCCFYEAVAGQRVFSVEGKSGIQAVLQYRDHHRNLPPTPLHQLAPHCPEKLEALLMCCLEKNPDQRWKDWQSLHEAVLKVYEDHCGVCYLDVPSREPSPMEVAVQAQSLTLLDGFSRAVHLRNLRERHDTSPYDFHLALSSYFHSRDESDEAQRQIERAIATKGDHDGYEAVSRLATYYLEQQCYDDAEELLKTYLQKHPNGTERILETAVRLSIARNDFDGAIKSLDSHQTSWRGRSLLAEVLKASGRLEAFEALLKAELEKTLNALHETIASLDADDEPAWAQEGDPEVLSEVLRDLDPSFDAQSIENAHHTYWPDLDGYPDFAAPMARISWILGELASQKNAAPDSNQTMYTKLAQRLDHPNRTEEFLNRDERWLWERGG